MRFSGILDSGTASKGMLRNLGDPVTSPDKKQKMGQANIWGVGRKSSSFKTIIKKCYIYHFPSCVKYCKN
jgi:hypothetical protein